MKNYRAVIAVLISTFILIFLGAVSVQAEVEKFSLGAAYTYVDAGKAAISQSAADNPLRGGLAGDYSTNHLHAFNLNVIYRF